VWYTGGAPIYTGVPKSLTQLARGHLAGIPNPVIYVAFVTVVLWFVLARLPLGRRLYAVGGNRRAAELSGIRSDRILIATFIGSGLLAAAAGVVLGSQLGSVVPGGETTYLLPAFAGAFLGATALTPGRFNPIGAVLATYTLSVAVSGLQQLGAPFWVQPVFNGTVLLVAVGLSGYAARSKAVRAKARQLARIEQRGTPPACLASSPPKEGTSTSHDRDHRGRVVRR
jgi:ribose transport system permease protein